jgi:hypothetical protein
MGGLAAGIKPDPEQFEQESRCALGELGFRHLIFKLFDCFLVLESDFLIDSSAFFALSLTFLTNSPASSCVF